MNSWPRLLNIHFDRLEATLEQRVAFDTFPELFPGGEADELTPDEVLVKSGDTLLVTSDPEDECPAAGKITEGLATLGSGALPAVPFLKSR